MGGIPVWASGGDAKSDEPDDYEYNEGS